jgi:hypothetical protein
MLEAAKKMASWRAPQVLRTMSVVCLPNNLLPAYKLKLACRAPKGICDILDRTFSVFVQSHKLRKKTYTVREVQTTKKKKQWQLLRCPPLPLGAHRHPRQAIFRLSSPSILARTAPLTQSPFHLGSRTLHSSPRISFLGVPARAPVSMLAAFVGTEAWQPHTLSAFWARCVRRRREGALCRARGQANRAHDRHGRGGAKVLCRGPRQQSREPEVRIWRRQTWRLRRR